MAKFPNRKTHKGALYAHYWDLAGGDAAAVEDQAAHSREMRRHILEDFGSLPSSIMNEDHTQNYPDPAAAGRNSIEKVEGNADAYGAQKAAGGRLSVFEGRLARTAIRLWSNPDDLVLDPYAGRAARLQAAKELGRRYVGFDPSDDAYEACKPHLDDDHRLIRTTSLDMLDYVEPHSADMVFTCPPYWNSEFYGDNGVGLEGTPDYLAYVEELAATLILASQALKPDRFMVFVLRGFFLHGTFLDTPAHLERYLSGAGLTFHDQVAKKFSHSRERFHSDVVAWRRTAQVHEQVLVYSTFKPKRTKAPYRGECYARNLERHEQEQKLQNRRQEVLRSAGLDPVDCAPLVKTTTF